MSTAPVSRSKPPPSQRKAQPVEATPLEIARSPAEWRRESADWAARWTVRDAEAARQSAGRSVRAVAAYEAVEAYFAEIAGLIARGAAVVFDHESDTDLLVELAEPVTVVEAADSIAPEEVESQELAEPVEEEAADEVGVPAEVAAAVTVDERDEPDLIAEAEEVDKAACFAFI